MAKPSSITFGRREEIEEISSPLSELSLSKEILSKCCRTRLKQCHPAKFQYLAENPTCESAWALARPAFSRTLLDLRSFLTKILADFESYFDSSQATLVGDLEILDLNIDIGDVHNSGYSTCFVTLPQGKFVYRPRSLSYEYMIEQIFSELQDFGIGRQSSFFGPSFTISPFINSSLLEANPLEHLQGIVIIHYVASLVGLTDMHIENFLCSNNKLIPIDVEAYQCFLERVYPFKTSIFPDYNFEWMGERSDISLVGSILQKHKVERGSFLKSLDQAIHTIRENQARIFDSVSKHLTPALNARRVYRPTADYSQLLKYIDDFHFEGRDKREALLKILNRYPSHHYSEIQEEEIEALLKGYIPVFYKQIDNYEELSSRIHLLSKDEGKLQQYLYLTSAHMQQAVDAFFFNNHKTYEKQLTDEKLLIRICGKAWASPSELRSNVHDVCDLILRQLSPFIERGIEPKSILTHQEIPETSLSTVGTLEDGLYNGYDGVLLFLAAAVSVLDYEEAKISGLVKNRSEVLLAQTPDSFGSLGSGMTGQLYALLSANQFLNDSRFVEGLFQKYVTCKPDPNSYTTTDADLFLGASGYYLVALNLLKGFPANPSKEILLNQILTFQSWLECEYLHGASENISFAHGDAGLLYLLGTLAKVFPSHAKIDLVEKLVTRIYQSYLENEGKFKDYRYDDTYNIDNYCSGTFGILIALEQVENKWLGAETKRYHKELIQSARLLTTKDARVARDICCTNVGFDFDEHYRCYHRERVIEARLNSPSLFKGSAGLAYLMLRRINPFLPNILTFELPSADTVYRQLTD